MESCADYGMELQGAKMCAAPMRGMLMKAPAAKKSAGWSLPTFSMPSMPSFGSKSSAAPVDDGMRMARSKPKAKARGRAYNPPM